MGSAPMILPLPRSDLGPRVVDAERLADGLLITFDNGDFAFYSSSLLHRTLPHAYRVAENLEE
jgi:hypothetical protein